MSTLPAELKPKPITEPRTGTDYRNDELGLYSWPHPFYQKPGETVETFFSVSSVLELLESFGRVRERWLAQHCVHLTELAKAREKFEKWDIEQHKMIEVKPVDMLADFDWMVGAGWRELNRYAARGTIVHSAIEEWVLSFAMGKPFPCDYNDDVELYQYVLDTIKFERQKRDGNFFVEPDWCWLYVRSALAWLDKHVRIVHMAEAPCFNRTFGYAGTMDLIVELYNEPGIWLIDAKSSASHYDSHRIQLAAYSFAEYVGVRDTLHPMPAFTRVANLYIQPDSARLREWWVDKKLKPVAGAREKSFLAFTSLMQMVMPEVKALVGEDGKSHAINPVTVGSCSIMPSDKKG